MKRRADTSVSARSTVVSLPWQGVVVKAAISSTMHNVCVPLLSDCGVEAEMAQNRITELKE